LPQPADFGVERFPFRPQRIAGIDVASPPDPMEGGIGMNVLQFRDLPNAIAAAVIIESRQIDFALRARRPDVEQRRLVDRVVVGIDRLVVGGRRARVQRLRGE
jgi:hypothetical protein